MQPVAWIRNGLIFAGIGVGGLLAITGAIASHEEAREAAETEQVAATPILLNVAKPPNLGSTPLSGPLSLESPFGRSELTGQPVKRVPQNPLEELDFDRSWDHLSAAKVPLPPADLPPEPATDEVAEPKRDETSLEEDPDLADLSPEARQRADAALVSLRSGSKLLKEGMNEFRQTGEAGREGSRKIREAADLLRDARDKLTSALALAPQHPELLRLMQEAKANLYICLKHGM
jgi:hypothetical protein